MKCLGVKGNLHSHRKLLHQIDYSSRLSHFKLFAIKDEFFPTLEAFLIDFGQRFDITAPGKKIPKWFNHESIESSISFWVGPKFPTFALCVAFHLVPLQDSFANNDNYGSICDDIISWGCDVNIFTNGHERPFWFRMFFQGLQSDHLWFHGEPHSQLQEEFKNLMLGDHNHVQVSCKIFHWTSETGKFAPAIARMGVHVECICPPRTSVIIHDNSQNVDDSTELAHLLPPFYTSNGSHTNLGCHKALRRRRPVNLL